MAVSPFVQKKWRPVVQNYQTFNTVGPRAPSAPSAPGVGAAQPPSATPRTPAVFTPDAQYIAAAAQAQHARTTRINELQAESETQRQMTQESIRRLLEDAVGQRQSTTEGANKQGLFYSGQLGKRLGDLETQIARARTDHQFNFDSAERAREAARQAILSGAPLEEAAMRAEAVERRVVRDLELADIGALAPARPQAAVVKPKPKPKPKSRRKRRYG